MGETRQTTRRADDNGGDAARRDFLSVQEFVRSSGLSASTVRRRVRDGSLPNCQPGGSGCRVLIPADALDRLANQEEAECPRPQEQTPMNRDDNQTPRRPEPKLSGPTPRWRGKFRS